jgi:predicted nucleic acid-binding protein
VRDVFVDTSAIYAHVAPKDPNHAAARRAFEDLAAINTPLITSSYVVHETVSLVQARLGLEYVRRFQEELAPLLDLIWLDRRLHDHAILACLAANQRRVSLTDWSSFVIMRERRMRRVVAFDPHFASQGFEVIPAAVTPDAS